MTVTFYIEGPTLETGACHVAGRGSRVETACSFVDTALPDWYGSLPAKSAASRFAPGRSVMLLLVSQNRENIAGAEAPVEHAANAKVVTYITRSYGIDLP